MITFVATAYKETTDAYLFISSLLLQKNSNWQCIIYCDEKNNYIEDVVKTFGSDKFTLVSNETPEGFWGHYNRKKSLNLVNSEFVIQTSIQDYYLPNTVSELEKLLGMFDFISFDCLHNHIGYRVLSSQPFRNQIDWGSFVMRTDIAKEIGINNLKSSICDGLFVEECMRYPGLRYHKLNKILTVHN
jgi:hypothetical protein